MNLFVYGTLMVPAIMRAVSGYPRTGQRAVLHGYARRRVDGEVYPGIFSRRGERVEGILYRAVGRAQIARLDRFEGDLYRRRPVEVRVGGRCVAAFSYVVARASLDALCDEPWKLEQFLRDGHGRFVAEYHGFAVAASRRERHAG